MRERIKRSLERNFPEDLEYILRDPLLFGDYRNAMNEKEPRVYEDLLDYDAVYYLFQEVDLFFSDTFYKCLKFICIPCTN
jgi:dynein heavy chain